MKVLKKIALFSIRDWPAWMAEFLAAKLNSLISPEFKRKNAVYSRMLSAGVKVKKQSPGVVDLSFTLNGKDYTVRNRLYNSDPEVFEQVILKHEYQPLVDLVKAKGATPKVLVDCGANVGFTSVYISAFFQLQKMVMVEPHSETFAMLKHNVKMAGAGAELLFENQGIWYKTTRLKVSPSFRDNKAWSFSLVEDEGTGDIPVIGLKELLEKSRIDTVDILKIDIEGAEKYLFRDDDDIESILSRTRFISIEIHDEMECRPQIEGRLAACNFEFFQAGELTIGHNKSFS